MKARSPLAQGHQSARRSPSVGSLASLNRHNASGMLDHDGDDDDDVIAEQVSQCARAAITDVYCDAIKDDLLALFTLHSRMDLCASSWS